MRRLGSPLRLEYWSLLLLSLASISGTAAAQRAISVPSTNFGTVEVGSSLIVPVAVVNSGRSTLTISHATAAGGGFRFVGPNLPLTLRAHQSTSLSVSFAPNAAGVASGRLTLAYSASGSRGWRTSNATGALAGTGAGGPAYLSAPSNLNFSGIAVGSSQSQAITLSNTGGTNLTISAATVSGNGFKVSGLSFPYSLAAGGSANLSVTFSPTASGTSTASLAIASNASDSSVIISLSGSAITATGALGLNPGSMSFGSITIGSAQTQSGSVTANGGSVTLSSVSSSNAAFTIGGLTLPMTLAAGQSVPFTVKFAPTVAGSASANISFFANNSTSTLGTATGSGATTQHRVDLSWSASTSTSVAGYNVYRATSTTGSYSRINSALNPSTSYSDSAVQSGQTYYYATTAVDSSGAESTYSNQVQVVIPLP